MRKALTSRSTLNVTYSDGDSSVDGEGDDDDLECEGSRKEETCAQACDDTGVKEAIARERVRESQRSAPAPSTVWSYDEGEAYGLCNCVERLDIWVSSLLPHLRHVYTGQAEAERVGKLSEKSPCLRYFSGSTG